MNTVNPAAVDETAILRALQASKAAAAAGRMSESDQLLIGVAQRAPNHPAVLNELGVRMMGRGSASEAHALFVRATSADPRHPSLWANLASSLKALGRRTEELDALEKALELEPRHLSALLQKGAHQEDTGDVRNAARTYQNALACLAPNAEVPAAVREALAHAKSLVQSDQEQLLAELEQPLAAVRERHGAGGPAALRGVPRDPDGQAQCVPFAADLDVLPRAAGDRVLRAQLTFRGSMRSRRRPRRSAPSCCGCWWRTARACSPTSTFPRACRSISGVI